MQSGRLACDPGTTRAAVLKRPKARPFSLNVRIVPEADIRVRHSYIVSARRPRLLLVWEIPTTIGLWAGPEW